MVCLFRYPIYLLILALILPACVPPGTVPSAITSETAASPGTSPSDLLTPATETSVAGSNVLRINMGTFPDIIDPQKSSSVSEVAVLKMVYEGLTRLDGDLNTVPAAAESWEYNEDATELVFTLRDGLTYSDGSPLNAARFEYSFHRNIDPATAGVHLFPMDEILGATEWRSCMEDCDALRDAFFESSRASHADSSDCTGYDDAACNTFTLKFQQPAPYFHTVVSLWGGYPAKQELIEAGGEDWWLDPANHLGNGPFVLTSLEQDVNVHMIPNEEYWANAPSYELDYSYITDPAVALENYKRGEIDIIVPLAESLATLRTDAKLSGQVRAYPSSCTFAVMFHQLKEPFTDPAVRQAFAYALDREGWVNDVLQGLGVPTLTWIPPGLPGYRQGETRFGYDPQKAQQTLTNAGYTIENGQLVKDGRTIEIINTFSDTPRNRARNEWLITQWKEVLGIDIPLNPVDATTYANLMKDVETSPQIFIFGWCADYPDPQNWFNVWKSNGKISTFRERIGFSNSEIDEIMTQADAELDPERRADLYQQVQDMLVEGSYVAFMWNPVNYYLVQRWVQGISQTAMDTDWPGAMVPTSITIEPHQMPQ